MTCSRGGAISVVVDHVTVVGMSPAARRATRRWTEIEPVLAGFACPAEVAAACRAACSGEQDRLIAALLAVSAGDEWAQLTIVAGLACRLDWVVAGWVRAGMAPGDVTELEADLVASFWTAIATHGDGPPPDRPGLVLVDRAWGQVRTTRRRQRRLESRLGPLPAEVPAAARDSGRPVLEVLAGEVTDAVAGHRLSLRQGRAVYLTRVAGVPTVEAAALMGCVPGVLRVLRCRAEHRLAA